MLIRSRQPLQFPNHRPIHGLISVPAPVSISERNSAPPNAIFRPQRLWVSFSLPQPYHGVFESEQFRTASLDAFWLGIETEGDTQALEEKLRGVGAARVHTVTEAQ